MRSFRRLFPVIGLSLASAAEAQQEPVPLPGVTVTAPRPLEQQPTDSGSERKLSGETINERPVTRPGELLEAAPGLIVVQHSGEGKANQYFLRGFNLDHGTDLAIWLDGMPVNMRTHAHAQGYADINFLIPELLGSMLVRKGPYFAEEGDFSSAGAIRLSYADSFEKNLASATGGSFGYWRGLVVGSLALGNGHLTAAGEVTRYDGPWQIPDAARKYNGVLRYVEGTETNGFSVTAMAYSNSWHATNQIPQRAVFDGSLSRWAAIDPTDGGDSQRYSLSARWSRSDERTRDRVEAYAIYQTLNLYNDFTFFLNDPVNGDQFQQADKRKIFGFNATHGLTHSLLGFAADTTLGAQLRYDDIALSLFNTVQRVSTSTIRQDQVSETSISLWAENKVRWNDWLRSTLGLRSDLFVANVSSNLAANSGQVTAFLPSPKAGLVFGPFASAEFFVNAGLGFHSNDARGATTIVAPSDGVTPVQPAPLLVRSRGAEIGMRSQTVKGLDAALSLFILEFDSELVFNGDSGDTSPGRPSRRIGVEWTNHYRPVDWALLDFDFAYTRARYTDYDAAGDFIANAPALVASAGLLLGRDTGWFGGLRWRYFGARPLIEDGSVYAAPTSLFNARLGYGFEDGLRIQLDVLNLLNSQANQIDYFYASRLPGEPAAGVSDVHFHPVEPQAIRLAVTKAF